MIFPSEYKFIPRGYTGILIDDLSNDYHDFSNGLLNYKICTHSEGLTECFNDPCNSGIFRPSNCNGSSERVALEVVDVVENGTEVSIFVTGYDCRHQQSNILLFNFVICKFMLRFTGHSFITINMMLYSCLSTSTSISISISISISFFISCANL